MFVVISGGGKVGAFLASDLAGKGHDVVLVEKDPEVVSRLQAELPSGVLLVRGDGCDVKVLGESGVGRADVFVAVTGQDDDNLVSCQLARTTFGSRRVLARVNSPHNERIFQSLGVEAISATTIIGRLVEEELSVGDLIRLHTLRHGRLALVEVELPQDPCPACRAPVAELPLPTDTILAMVVRGEGAFVPRGQTVLEPGDRVIAVTAAGREDELRVSLLGL